MSIDNAYHLNFTEGNINWSKLLADLCCAPNRNANWFK